MSAEFDPQIRMIPVKQITILNPRDRGKRKFAQIVQNIATIGLKRPITVTPLENKEAEPCYGLVCGQGRLEAYIALGEESIPAIVISGTKEDCLLMSLAENIARRQHSTLELVREVNLLKERGYSIAEIARKTEMNADYVRGILQLFLKGEAQLLQAVEKGQIPVSIAITIATADSKAIQKALTEAYERNTLRGKALLRARRLIENRRTRGKDARGRKMKPNNEGEVSSAALLKTYQHEALRQKLIVQRAKTCETRLLFATSAIKKLFSDESFVNLLRAEGLNSLPEYLAKQVYPSEHGK